MPSGPTILSDTELFALQESVRVGVRLDGRSLLQHREIWVSGETATAESPEGEDLELSPTTEPTFTEVKLGETHCTATATPSVFRDAAWENGDESTESEGRLEIAIDVVPEVKERYAAALLGSSSGSRGSQRQRSALLFSSLALTVRQLFGARNVRVVNETLSDGVAAAQVVLEEENEEGGLSEGGFPEGVSGSLVSSGIATGFPAKELYIGKGFAFQIHVDVHISEGGGGNALTAVSTAIYFALQRLRLPHVVLHESPQGVSAEVDTRRAYAGQPPSFAQLSRLVVLGISPTRQFIVDPTWEEEMAFPQQIHVGVQDGGVVSFSRYQQFPSRHGGRRLGCYSRLVEAPEEASSKRVRQEENAQPSVGFQAHTVTTIRPVHRSGTGEWTTGDAAFPLGAGDLLSVLSDAIHAIGAVTHGMK